MNKCIADVLQELRQEKKTGALFITVDQSAEYMLRFWLAGGDILRLGYGPLGAKECLDVLDSYDFGRAVFFEGMTSQRGADDQCPGTACIIDAFRDSGKTIEVLYSQWWPGRNVALARPQQGSADVEAAPAEDAVSTSYTPPTRRVASVAWTPDLSIDVPLIDDQHKELFSHIDALVKAWSGGRGGTEVESIIKFLEGYILTHFRTEEQFMIKYAYASRLAHMNQHEVFTQSFGRLKARYYCSGVDDDLIADTVDLIVEWFRNHIRYTDRAFGLFLKVKMYDWKAA